MCSCLFSLSILGSTHMYRVIPNKRFIFHILSRVKKKKNGTSKPKRTFNSLIFSSRFSFDSFNFWASPCNWDNIRTASPNITAFSILGSLPGSRIELNSRNLKIMQRQHNKERRREGRGRRKLENKRMPAIQSIPPHFLSACFWIRYTAWFIPHPASEQLYRNYIHNWEKKKN